MNETKTSTLTHTLIRSLINDYQHALHNPFVSQNLSSNVLETHRLNISLAQAQIKNSDSSILLCLKNQLCASIAQLALQQKQLIFNSQNRGWSMKAQNRRINNKLDKRMAAKEPGIVIDEQQVNPLGKLNQIIGNVTVLKNKMRSNLSLMTGSDELFLKEYIHTQPQCQQMLTFLEQSKMHAADFESALIRAIDKYSDQFIEQCPLDSEDDQFQYRKVDIHHLENYLSELNLNIKKQSSPSKCLLQSDKQINENHAIKNEQKEHQFEDLQQKDNGTQNVQNISLNADQKVEMVREDMRSQGKTLFDDQLWEEYSRM